MSPATDLLTDLRWVDVLDILVVSALVFLFFAWIRTTQAGFIAIGLLGFAAIYLGARALDLSLLAGLFQGSVAVFALIAVVIFQQELRQLFERVAMWGLRRQTLHPQSKNTTEILVDTLTELARSRTGALIVVCGEQPLDRHIDGGVPLDALPSRQLLLSLFDDSSPGHDGAVVVCGDRVTRFAAHLPLSQNFAALGDRGTRHAAALGLSELTDCLCLVASEETGQVSIAKGGTLRRVERPLELTPILRESMQPSADPAPQQSWGRVARRHLLEGVGAIAVVTGLWFAFVVGAIPTERVLRVPVQVTDLPGEFELSGVEPPEVEVRLQGERRSFYLPGRELARVSIDASLARLGRRTFTLEERDLVVPDTMTLLEVVPSTVRISVTPRPNAKAQ